MNNYNMRKKRKRERGIICIAALLIMSMYIYQDNIFNFILGNQFFSKYDVDYNDEKLLDANNNDSISSSTANPIKKDSNNNATCDTNNTLGNSSSNLNNSTINTNSNSHSNNTQTSNANLDNNIVENNFTNKTDDKNSSPNKIIKYNNQSGTIEILDNDVTLNDTSFIENISQKTDDIIYNIDGDGFTMNNATIGPSDLGNSFYFEEDNNDSNASVDDNTTNYDDYSSSNNSNNNNLNNNNFDNSNSNNIIDNNNNSNNNNFDNNSDNGNSDVTVSDTPSDDNTTIPSDNNNSKQDVKPSDNNDNVSTTENSSTNNANNTTNNNTNNHGGNNSSSNKYNGYDPTIEFGSGKIINIKEKGAKGDGVTDDSAIINSVLNSGAKYIYFPAGEYKCKYRIEVNNVNQLVIFGDGQKSKIVSSSDYVGADTVNENFFTLWESNNIRFKSICFKACEKWTVSYSRQVAVYYSSNISFNDCYFLVPSDVKSIGKNVDREYTNLILYTGWKNITVNNCYFEQLGAVERGSNIIITDIWNAGCDTLSVTNNIFYHNAHDEMFSLFGGKTSSSYMKNITIKNNFFNAMYSDDVSPRTMGFTFAYTDSKNVSNVSFTNNTINATIPSSLMTFGVIDNCKVSDNLINIVNNTYYNNGIAFSGTKNVCVESNTINVYGTKANSMSILAAGDMSFKNNKVNLNSSMTYVFTEGRIVGNVINLSSYAKSISQAPIEFSNNTVNMSKRVDNFISYIQTTLSHSSIINNNTFNYNYDDTNDASSLLTGNAVYINIGTKLCNNIISFTNNTINASKINPFRKYLLAYCVTDSTKQKIILKKNISATFKDHVYLGQGPVADIVTE